jgi:putative peptidoglycan lipid II flippase
MPALVEDLPIVESPVPAAETPSAPIAISADRGIVRAAAVIAVGNVASRGLGLLREIVKSNQYGASGLLGAYTVAVLVPMTLFNLLAGGEMVSSSLVPVFSDYASAERRKELWSVLSTVLNLTAVLLVGIVILLELFAPQVAWLAGARNFEDRSLIAVTVALMRLATPALLFLSLASIITGALFALQRFTLPAFTAAVFNGTIVAVALIRPYQIEALTWGLLLGAVLQVGLQWPALRDARFSLRVNWRHPAIKRILILYAPIVAGLVVNQVAVWISYNLAITTGDNSVTYMAYATTLYQFPLGLVVTALSVATLPALSVLASAYAASQQAGAADAARRLEDYKETLASGLRLAITLVLPAAAGLFALATPIVRLLLEHGQFTPADTDITALVLRVYLFGLPFAAVDQMLVYASYARKDTWRPALVGVVTIIIYTVLAVLLLPWLGLLSLMVADAAKHFLHTMVMLLLLRRHAGQLGSYQMAPLILRSLVAAGLTGVVAYTAAALLAAGLPDRTLLNELVVVLGAGLAGLGVYLAAVFLLKVEDALAPWRIIWRRIRG